MLPFYFLTILLNAITGYILAFRGEETRDGGGFSLSFNNEVFRLALGAASIFTGLLKILSPIRADGNLLIIGDIVPALANLAGGLILVFEYYRNRTTVQSEAAEKIGRIVEKNRKLAGFVSIAAAVLHFIFSPVLFL
ncbi:MAG: hypothetical protein LBI67_07375 [Treponema sp.]|jgi:hypothetical protein|nr:hypothetical protein [Treponema sp.]